MRFITKNSGRELFPSTKTVRKSKYHFTYSIPIIACFGKKISEAQQKSPKPNLLGFRRGFSVWNGGAPTQVFIGKALARKEIEEFGSHVKLELGSLTTFKVGPEPSYKWS